MRDEKTRSCIVILDHKQRQCQCRCIVVKQGGRRSPLVMRIKTLVFGIVVGLAVLLGGRRDAAAVYYTGWISEEAPNNYTYCFNSWDDGAYGFQCSGSYCDNVRLAC